MGVAFDILCQYVMADVCMETNVVLRMLQNLDRTPPGSLAPPKVFFRGDEVMDARRKIIDGNEREGGWHGPDFGNMRHLHRNTLPPLP
eukprot:28042-Eustigmatos_ZCMA.PRE.1